MSTSIKINEQNDSKPTVKILCFNLTNQSQTMQFLLCCVAVFFFFLLYGYMQELIFTLEGFQPYGWYLTLVQFLCYTIFGLLEKLISNVQSRK